MIILPTEKLWEERSRGSTDSIAKIAFDSFRSTLWENKDSSLESDMFSFNGFEQPSQWQIPDEDKWAIATRTPEGFFTCFIVPRDAYETIWRFKKDFDGEDVSIPLRKRLLRLKKKYDLYQVHTRAVSISSAMGWALVARVKKDDDPYNWHFKAFILHEQDVEYNDDGSINHYRPWGRKGNKWGRYKIPPKDAILYHDVLDPCGNGYEAIPRLLPIMNTMTYLVNMKHGFATTIAQRGFGLMLLKVKGDPGQIDDSTLEEYSDNWGDPTSFSTMTFPEEEMEVDLKEGLGKALNFTTALTPYVFDVSSGTGVGHNRLQGVENARAMGIESDQDNYSSVLETIQHHYDPFLLGLFTLADPWTRNKFVIEHEFKIKRSKKHQADVMNLQANAIIQLSSVLTLGEARDMLSMDDLEGKDPNKTVQETINEQTPKPEMGAFGNPMKKNTKGESKPLGKPDPQKSTDDKNRPRIGKDATIPKNNLAEILIRNKVSGTITNKILKEIYGQGKSLSAYTQWK